MSTRGKDVTVISIVSDIGRFMHPSALAVDAAIRQAETTDGLSVQWLAATYCPSESTIEYFQTKAPSSCRPVLTDATCSLSARNTALELAQGRFVVILSGYDLLSANFLSAGFQFLSADNRQTVAHPALVVSFGAGNSLYMTPDQEDSDFDHSTLFSSNPWPSLYMSRKELFLAYPFEPTAHSNGFGQGDWHWICQTIAGGVLHKPVCGTFTCCHRQQGHTCLSDDDSPELLLPSKLFETSGRESYLPLER